ncbi:MAG: glycosyltransferase [Coriobacteriales bacterium]|jgi:glycosyltransferase involved in cell wall biosynthesis|nr:glycosyltransferase [Coriobacteriales bacterium]
MITVALIAAYNEGRRIAATVNAAAALPGVAAVLLVDDGSTDDTATVAEAAGAVVLRLAHNSGKGAALEAGCAVLEALGVEGRGGDVGLDAVLLLDGDLGASASEAALLLEPLERNEADLAIAILPSPAKSGGFGLVKRLASRAITRAAGTAQRGGSGSGTEGGDTEGRFFWGDTEGRFFCVIGESITKSANNFFNNTKEQSRCVAPLRAAPQAPLSGQRAIRASALPALRPFAHGFGVEVAMTIRALQAGLRIIEVPTAMTHAATGRDLKGFLHRARQYRDIRRALRRLCE